MASHNAEADEEKERMTKLVADAKKYLEEDDPLRQALVALPSDWFGDFCSRYGEIISERDIVDLKFQYELTKNGRPYLTAICMSTIPMELLKEIQVEVQKYLPESIADAFYQDFESTVDGKKWSSGINPHLKRFLCRWGPRVAEAKADAACPSNSDGGSTMEAHARLHYPGTHSWMENQTCVATKILDFYGPEPVAKKARCN